MNTPDLLFMCLAAFIAVFILLTALAVIMRIILRIFPAKAAVADPAILAAIASTMNSVYPNTQITKIEEVK
ncbi:MAG: hypothetical protein ACLFQX_08475 [Candidatus Kapaibacterium sp.]